MQDCRRVYLETGVQDCDRQQYPHRSVAVDGAEQKVFPASGIGLKFRQTGLGASVFLKSYISHLVSSAINSNCIAINLRGMCSTGTITSSLAPHRYLCWCGVSAKPMPLPKYRTVAGYGGTGDHHKPRIPEYRAMEIRLSMIVRHEVVHCKIPVLSWMTHDWNWGCKLWMIEGKVEVGAKALGP